MRAENNRTALVVGGGVVGRSIAAALQASHVTVTIVDPDDTRAAASWGNAGHIAVEQVAPLASRATLRAAPRRLSSRGGPLALPWRDTAAWLPFGARLAAASHPRRFAAGERALAAMLAQSMPAWRRLLTRIGARDLLREDGHFVVWESPATARAGAQRWAAANVGTACVRAATAAELARIAACMTTPPAGAVHIAGSGQITDLPTLADQLAASLAARGGAMRAGVALRMIVEQGRARVLLDDGATLDADIVVVAAGARTPALLRPLGHSVPLIAERGYHIQSGESGWPADMPPVVFEDRSMIVTRFRLGLRAAGFVEFARVDSAPDARKWARLRAHVAALGLSFRLPGSEWMGARPTLPDYLPAIGRSDAATNLFYAFGHQHLGLTLAATTGEAVAALARGEPPPYDLAPFDLTRFGPRS